MSVLEHWLSRFQATRRPGSHPYEWCHQHRGAHHEFHVVFSSMVHGNEVGSLPGLVEVMEALESGALEYGGRVSFFIGNPEAGRAGVRMLEADLNRVFLDVEGDLHEMRRARKIMPLLDSADLYIDFHQTYLHTEHPFYIMLWRPDLWHWARALASAPAWVTSAPGQAFSPGTCCADEYVRNQGRPALTIELSQAGFSEEATRLSVTSMTRALGLADALQQGQTIEELADLESDLVFYQTHHREPVPDSRLALRAGLRNFQTVEQGELLSAPGTPEIRAPLSGKLLFPKYPERDPQGRAIAPYSREIFRLVQAMQTHPMTCWG
jgi:succinylglutamate desuccinylase